MEGSMAAHLQQDMECESLLECFHGLKGLDQAVFEELVQADDHLTVDEIAERVDRERSTAYRAVQRLLQSGSIRKEQVNYDQGGYYHVYQPVPADRIADEMQRLLNDWYAQMGALIGEFRSKYAEAAEPATAGD